MPIEVKIPKEIREYRESIFFGLSARQFTCSLLALGAALTASLGHPECAAEHRRRLAQQMEIIRRGAERGGRLAGRLAVNHIPTI